jgi:hypothetical protein
LTAVRAPERESTSGRSSTVTSEPRWSPRQIALTAVVWILLLYHAGIGVLSIFFPAVTADVSSGFYGTRLTLDAQSEYMLKALGMYALFVAAILGIAARDLSRYRALLLAVAGLQVLRALSRLVYYDVLSAGLEVSTARNAFNVTLLLIEATVLVVCSRPGR